MYKMFCVLFLLIVCQALPGFFEETTTVESFVNDSLTVTEDEVQETSTTLDVTEFFFNETGTEKFISEVVMQETSTGTESNVTEGTVGTESKVTESTVGTESKVTESTVGTESKVTDSTVGTESKVTDSTVGTESNATESSLASKSIDEGANGQSLVPAVIWNGPVVKTQSVRTKANWTTKVLNGESIYTDISVYNSHGRNYQFRIPGSLPQETPGGIIKWVRENSHKYPQIDLEYVEYGSDIVKYPYPPKELPLRCGTTFLEKLSGGKASPIEENPWQVAVLRREFESYICGGAVITRRHVLSAAHCFKRKNRVYLKEDILLRVGDYDKEVREESQVDYSVIDLNLHENYHETRHLHDIALLTTNEDIPFSSHIYPICLPPPWAEYSAGLKCTVSGWGQNGADETPNRYLRSGQVSIISKTDCQKKTFFSRGVPPEIFCAEDPTKQGVDTCLGDSGGPFACSQNGTFYLYGITAFGSYPCGQDVPSFYTNVSFYKIWILHLLSKN